MAPFTNPFRRRAPRHPAHEAIRGWAAAALGPEPPFSLTISEIDCGDLACPGLETIILVLREGEATQAVKVRKPIADVTQADIEAAFALL